MDSNETRNPTPEGNEGSARSEIWWYFAAVITSFIASGIDTCICGHFGARALPFSLLGALLSWFPFWRNSRQCPYELFFVLLCVIFSTFIFVKNVADVLYFGHSPLFGW